MTHREMIINTIEAKQTDYLPFIPRIDLWYKANKYAGTLPDKYKNANIRDITDDLNIGYHCLLPDFSNLEEDGDLDIGLGVYHLKTNCYKIIFHNIERTYERHANGDLRVTYRTPHGELTTSVILNEKMKKSGITLYVVKEHAIKSENDWEAIALSYRWGKFWTYG